MSQIKFGVCESCLPEAGPEVCRAASEVGLSGVALEIGHILSGLQLAEECNQRRYLEAAQKYGVEFCALALNTFGEYTLLHPEKTEEDQVVRDILRRSIQTAANLRIPVIQVPSFFDNGIRTQKDMEATAGYLREMCEMAERHGIIIGSENLLNAEGNRELMSLVDRPNFKIYFDTQNAIYFGVGDPETMIRRLGPENICQIHIKDGTKENLGSVRLGAGNGHFLECMEAIRDIDYSGWIVLENYYDRLEELAEDVRILKSIASEQTWRNPPGCPDSPRIGINKTQMI